MLFTKSKAPLAPIEKLGLFVEIVLRFSLQPDILYFRIDDALRSVIFAELWLVYLCLYGNGEKGKKGKKGKKKEKKKMMIMEGDVLRSSDFLAFCSLTRLARRAVYSL